MALTEEERKTIDEMVERFGLLNQGINIYNEAGEKVGNVAKGTNGITTSGQKVYRKDDGSFTADPLAVSRFHIDAEGNIKITAPKSITETPEFQQIFDSGLIKSYSAAYKTDRSYRVPYTQMNEDGTTEEAQITIPELVEKYNDALSSFISNYKVAEKNRETLNKKYDGKATGLSLSQISLIQNSGANASRIYLPDFIFNFDSPLKALENVRQSDGTVSVDEFNAVYNRSKMNQEDLAGIMATIEGHLRASDWGEDTITYEGGETVKNPNSASEATKALAFKNYILSKDPNAEWWQSAGDGIVALAANAGDGFTSVILNTLGTAEYVLSWGNSSRLLDINEEKKETFSAWNTERALIQDSTTTLATLGQIGGALGGVAFEVFVTKAAGAGISAAYTAKAGEAAEAVAAVQNMGPSAQAALTAESLASIKNLDTISRGARFVIATAPVAQKVAWATGTYQAFMNAHKGLNWATSLLLDTVHDAIVFDATTLRHVLESSDDQNVKNYWLSQLQDNSKWWIGTAVARHSLRWAGKTTIGEALNVKTTQYVNEVLTDVGDKKRAVKDYFYGGDVVRHLEKQLENTKKGTAKYNRLVNKIQIERENVNLRKARRAVAELDLDWDGMKLSDESARKYREATNSIRQVENSIDHYNQSVVYKQMEILGVVKDPSTGLRVYVNPELGYANARTTKTYQKLLELTEKYNLPLADHSKLGQSLVDYLVGVQEFRMMEGIAGASGVKQSDALRAAETIRGNLSKLELELPTEVLNYLKRPETLESYTAFYGALNDYGISKGLLDAETINSYRANPIWKNGYMPIQKEVDISGRWVPDDGRYHALIQEDIEHFTYAVKEGQHYVDPELTRQYRINAMAKTETNAELLKAYQSIESATNKIIVSGEETQRVKNYQANKKSLDFAIARASEDITENMFFFSAEGKRRKPVKNLYFNLAERTEAISTFSLSDTTRILQEKNILSNGSKRLSDIVASDNYDAWFAIQSKPVKNYLISYYNRPVQQLGRESDFNNYQLFQKAVQDGGDDFEAGLQRAYLIGDEKFAKSSILNQAITNMVAGKDAFYGGYVATSAKGYLKNVQGLDTDEYVDGLIQNFRTGIDEYVDNVLDNPGAKKAIVAIAGSGENGAALSGKYVALQRLIKDEQVFDDIWSEVEKSLSKDKLSGKDMDTIKRHTKRVWEETVRSELNDAEQGLRTTNSILVNSQNIYEEVDVLAQEIYGAEQSLKNNVVMYMDNEGRQIYAEVDPNFASLYNYRYAMTKADASAMAKFNAATSKLFRFGTTTLNVKSFGNQLFRDTGNALFVGGAWQSIKASADNMAEVFGDDIVDQIKRFDPTGYEMRQVEAFAEQTGQTIQEAAVSRELARGAAVSPATTETTLYKQFMKEAYSTSDGLLDDMKARLEGIVDKYNPDEYVNGKRETYLRNRVYANNLNEALKQGYNVEQARAFATFAMNNATTNFSRQVYHMQAIADSTPYFKAAINGTKSFWRMWSLDPVGITGRIMGGLVLPTIFLTGASLADPENKEVYENIPEYQKTDSLIFVVDKQVISIPMPQEMGSLIAPWRQFVEYLHQANPNDFWELMMNDALGLSPIDLTGYSTIDMDKMIKDPTLVDRIDRGTARVFSAMAPVPMKSLYMIATGTDPYSGKTLSDPSYTYWDDTTNELQVMDYSQSKFAKAIATAFGKAGREDANYASPAVLEKVVSGTVGSTGSLILDSITAAFTEDLKAGAFTLGEGIVEQATAPFYVDTYNQADAVWKRAVRELTAQKNQITSSQEYKAIYSKLSQTTDEETRKKLIASGQNIISEFQNSVAETVKRLESVYGGAFDRKKFAATVNLLNFNSDPIYQSGTQASSDIASDAFYEGRDMAIATMAAMGANGTSDLSIFGYLTTNAQGQSVMKYAEPTAIMEARNAWYSASDIDTANIEAKLKTDGINKSDMWDGYYTAKAKGSAALKQYKSDWNAKVVRSLAPYISERGVDSVLSNSATRDLLEDYLMIDDKYKVKQYLYKIFGGQ